MSFQNFVRLSQIKKKCPRQQSVKKNKEKMTINAIQHDDRL
jgi:hypothetical protein